MTDSNKTNLDVDKKPPQTKEKDLTNNIIKEQVNVQSLEEKQEDTKKDIIDNANNGNEEKKENEINSQPAVTKRDEHFEKIDNLDKMSHQSEPSPDPNKIDLSYSERENFLQNKLSQLNISNVITKVVNTGLETTLIKIEDDIDKEKLRISNNSKELSKLLPSYNITSIPEIVNSKKAMKTIRQLKRTEAKVQNNLYLINQNKKALADESFLNISNSQIESNIRNAHLKDLQQKQEILMNQLNEIKSQVDRVIDNEKKIDRKTNIKEFLEKFENEKDDYEERVHKYEEQSMLLKQRRMNDISRSIEKRNKQIEEKEREEKEKKAKLLEEKRNKEREVIMRRKKEIDEQMEKTKQYINIKFNRKPKDYIYFKMQKQYETNENRVYDRVKQERKSKLTTREEIGELRRKIKEHKILLEKENIEKTCKMKEMWRNRSQIIPVYRSPLLKVIADEEEKSKENEELEKMKKKLIMKERNVYAKEKVPRPHMNQKLKKEREKRLVRMKDRRGKNRVKYIRQLRKKRQQDLYIKQTNKTQVNRVNKNPTHNLSPLNFPKMIKSNSAIDIRTNEKIQEILSKKPKRSFIAPITVKTKPTKPIDYLSELRKNKMIHQKKQTNWNRIISNPRGNKIENLQLVKNQVDLIEEKAHLQKELMRINGGYAKNPDIGDKVSDLLIDSIKAKLTIINTLKANAK